MCFLYFLFGCITSTLLTSVNTYVVLTANRHDFRALAKKVVPETLVDHVKEIILENNQIYNRDIEDIAGEDVKQKPHDDFNESEKLINIYELTDAPKAQRATATVLTIDDIVKIVKQRLLHETKSNSGSVRSYNAQASKTIQNKKYRKQSKARKSQLENPMKIYKEEVQFADTYKDEEDEDANFKEIIVSRPTKYFVRNPVSFKSNAKNLLDEKDGLEKPQHEDGAKKSLAKQVVVPTNSNQDRFLYIPRPSLIQLPMSSLDKQLNLEPQLSLKQEQSFMQKLGVMQKQIDRLDKIIEEKVLKKKVVDRPMSQSVLEAPKLNIEAMEAHFVIVPNQRATEEKTNEAIESKVSAETATEAVVTETSKMPSTVKNEHLNDDNGAALETPETVENEPYAEDNKVGKDTAVTVENDHEAALEEKSIDEEDSTTESNAKPIAKSLEGILGDDARLGTKSKEYTKEFGIPDEGVPIVEKTYNFNEPKAVDSESVTFDLPVNSARKVMLF